MPRHPPPPRRSAEAAVRSSDTKSRTCATITIAPIPRTVVASCASSESLNCTRIVCPVNDKIMPRQNTWRDCRPQVDDRPGDPPAQPSGIPPDITEHDIAECREMQQAQRVEIGLADRDTGDRQVRAASGRRATRSARTAPKPATPADKRSMRPAGPATTAARHPLAGNAERLRQGRKGTAMRRG